MTTGNEHIWKDLGIVKKGYPMCEEVYPILLAACRRAQELGDDTLGAIGMLFMQAKFEINELPNRTKEYQEKVRYKPSKRVRQQGAWNGFFDQGPTPPSSVLATSKDEEP